MKIRKLNRRDRIEWVLDYYAGPKRIRKWFKSKALADAERENILGQQKQCGADWIDLTAEERNEVMSVYSEAKREQVSLRQIWEAFKNGKLEATPLQRWTLRQAVDATIAADIKRKGIKDDYTKSLEQYLKLFIAGRSEIFVDKITKAHIDEWFSKRNEPATTRNSNLGRLGSMFKVCWQHEAIRDRPDRRVQSLKIISKTPVIFTAEQAKKVLEICTAKTPEVLPYIVLGMFAGVRPEETEKLRWRDVHLKLGKIVIEDAAAKTDQRRTITLHPTAIAWLKTFKQGQADDLIAPSQSTIKRKRKKIREAMGWESWPQDILRKTAASYLAQHHQDVPAVALMLGNSERILKKNYLDMVTAERDCKKFLALKPKKKGSR
jgi:integrase